MELLYAFGRASLAGGAAPLAAWLICRLRPTLPARARCWLWRLAYVALYVAFFAILFLSIPFEGQSAAGQLPLALAGRSALSLDVIVPVEIAFAAFWLVGVVIASLRLARAYAWTRSLRFWAVRAAGEAPAVCADIANRLNIRPCPPVLVVEDIATPMLVGVSHPAILLPARMHDSLTSAELRAVLAHELAHLKHRDLMWRAMAALARIVFFYHPIIRLAESEWHLAQEIAADEQAIVVSRVPVSHYGTLLLGLALRRSPRRRVFSAGQAATEPTFEPRLYALGNRSALARRAAGAPTAGRAG
jgi:beta-lactamase regulating signal transducer with metallopeptidase domain